jgi:hypothetical protein
MFSEPGFWIMIAGGAVVVFGFLGLAFSRIGKEMPDQPRNIEPNVGELAPSDELPDPFPTESTAAQFGRGPKAKK